MVLETQVGFSDQKGMRRDGPNQGILIAADPATVERRGRYHRPGKASVAEGNGAVPSN
jgi:hypothetical protein